MAIGSPKPSAQPSPSQMRLPSLAFVDGQHDRLARAAHGLGDDLVGRGDAFASVDHEQADIGFGDGRHGVRGHPRGEAVLRAVGDTGGVDQLERQRAQHRLGLAPVAGDARRVVDQREFPARQLVEERGFADIGPADNGDGERHITLSSSAPPVFQRSATSSASLVKM